ncbi:hypothetical protein R1flu_024439 [Riccia fluitans]|uniref:Uncharacterized protein n=1 Tax=Riccia fluitans TaxID=41844 RepID=A0ABD1XV23_9MARC
MASSCPYLQRRVQVLLRIAALQHSGFSASCASLKEEGITESTPKWYQWRKPQRKTVKRDAGGGEVSNLVVADSQIATSTITSFPSGVMMRPMGNKVAKEMEFQNRKKMKSNTQVSTFDKISVEFLAVSKWKGTLMKDQMAFNLFSLTPDAPESIEFFAVKRATLLAEAKATLESLYPQNQDLAPVEESSEFDRLQHQVQISSITAVNTADRTPCSFTNLLTGSEEDIRNQWDI